MGVADPIFMIEDKASNSLQRDLPGSITTKKRKLDMIDLLKTKYLKPGNIGFFFQFISANQERSRLDDIKVEIIKEMRAFEKKKKLKVNNEGESYYEIFYNGKSNGEDDYVLATAIGVYWKEVFFDKNSRKYSFYW